MMEFTPTFTDEMYEKSENKYFTVKIKFKSFSSLKSIFTVKMYIKLAANMIPINLLWDFDCVGYGEVDQRVQLFQLWAIHN